MYTYNRNTLFQYLFSVSFYHDVIIEEETKMKKEHYELSEMEIIKFTTEDVIMTSPLEEDETPLNTSKP